MSGNKFIGVGPEFGNTCCHCGQIGVAQSGVVCSDSSGFCSASQGSDGHYNFGGGLGGLSVCTCNTCCPCPETGNYTRTASISVNGDSCSYSSDLTLDGSLGLQVCSNMIGNYGSNDECYGSNNPHRFSPYEKYAYSGKICDPQGLCSGENVVMALCCCNGGLKPPAIPRAGVTGDCHVCNYSFSIRWLPSDDIRAGDSPCSTNTGCYTKEMPIFGMRNTPRNYDDIFFSNPFWDFELLSGSCDPFALEFQATGTAPSPYSLRGGGLWYNCDCCGNGDTEGDNNVVITVTIT